MPSWQMSQILDLDDIFLTFSSINVQTRQGVNASGVPLVSDLTLICDFNGLSNNWQFCK
jgi:hypothetical protein